MARPSKTFGRKKEANLNGRQAKRANSNEVLFVSHPPEEMTYTEGLIHTLPNLYLRGFDVEFLRATTTEQMLTFSSIRKKAIKERTPFNFLEYFVAIHKLGVYPPIAILNWLCAGFEKFFEKGGRFSLEQALGLVGKRGQSDYFSNMVVRRRDRFCCEQVFLFTKTFGIPIEDAADIVSSFLTGEPGEFGIPNVKVKKIKAETIADKYKKRKEWLENRKSMEKYWAKEFSKTSLDEKLEILRRVPHDSLPPKLQRMHPDHTTVLKSSKS